jgi:hypothetical protein
LTLSGKADHQSIIFDCTAESTTSKILLTSGDISHEYGVRAASRRLCG